MHFQNKNLNRFLKHLCLYCSIMTLIAILGCDSGLMTEDSDPSPERSFLGGAGDAFEILCAQREVHQNTGSYQNTLNLTKSLQNPRYRGRYDSLKIPEPDGYLSSHYRVYMLVPPDPGPHHSLYIVLAPAKKPHTFPYLIVLDDRVEYSFPPESLLAKGKAPDFGTIDRYVRALGPDKRFRIDEKSINFRELMYQGIKESRSSPPWYRFW